MVGYRKQQGLTFIGAALLAFLIIFFGLLAVKLTGPYIDHMTINKMIEYSLDDTSAGRFEETVFRDRLDKNMEINNINIDLQEQLTVNTRKQPIIIELDYEKRVHFVANVSIVLSFQETYEL